MVDVDNEYAALVVAFNPIVVAVVEVLQVVEADAVFVGASALLNLAHEGRNTRVEVNQQVGSLDKLLHESEELLVGVEVARRHEAHVVKVRGEDVGVLVNRAVLDDALVLAAKAVNLAEPAVQEVNLQVERPPSHVVVELVQVGVFVHLFEVGLPAVVLGE